MSRTYKSSLVSQKYLSALKRAIDEAEGWRGSMIGNPDPEPLEEFDEFIMTARKALKAVRKLNNEIRLERRRPTPGGLNSGDMFHGGYAGQPLLPK